MMSMALQHPAALCLHGGMASSPTSSTATATSSGTLVASPHSNPEVGPSSAFQHQQQMGVASMLPGSGTASYCTSREWLYRLVTFPSYFTPCVSCCGGSRAPKREQLMTQFDTMYPYKVYCSHCPEVRTRTDGSLLQVRRSAFKDVVKATDILRFGCDVAGVQQYTLNGSKVIYLNREQTPERKGNGASTAPAFCSVCARAMMDKSSQYCSVKCKMQAEDAGFNQWLDAQDPEVRTRCEAYVNQPPRPTAACKRVQPTSSTSSGDDNTTTDTSSRPKKAPRTSSSGTATTGVTPTALGGVGGQPNAPPAAVAGGAPGMSGMGSRVMVAPPVPSAFARQQLHQPPSACGALQRAVSVTLPAGGCSSGGALGSIAAAALKPIRTSQVGRQNSAPGAFLEAAMADPLLGPPSHHRQGPGALCCSSWLPCPDDLDLDLDSCAFGSWDSALSSPSFAALDDAWASEDGGISPELILGTSSGTSSAADWWPAGGAAAGTDGEEADEAGLLLPGSPSEGGDMLMLGPHSLSGAALMLH